MFNLTYIIAVVSVFVSSVFSLEMRMNTLYITDGDKNSVVNSMFDAYGMNYETLQFPVNSLTLEKDNVALYNAIVIENGTKELLSQISKQINDYQKKYKVRVAYLNTEPDSDLGFVNTDKNLFMKSIYLTDEGLKLAKANQMNGKNGNFDIATCIYNVQAGQCDPYNHYEVSAASDSFTTLMKYNDTQNIAGGILKNKDNTESIYFFIPFVDSIVAYFSSHLWISWTNYGIIDGFRRLYFDIQIDDFFINNLFNYIEGTGFRTSVEDMQGIAAWQKDVVQRMPAGSEYKTELALNGIHVLIEANHKQYVAQNWTTTPVERSYVKPLSDPGSNRWPETVDSDWDVEALKADKLYAYFAQNPTTQDDFYWLTHTFSHQNLDMASAYDAYMETALNIKMTEDPYLGMYKRECFSQHSIVCPEISGLHNGHVLQMFEKNGITYAVGDTSREDLKPENYYLPLITNQTSSNFDGFVVIPRQPPQIYWDCSTVDQNLEQYKTRYGQPIEWNTHLNNEANLHVKNFLKLRHDPYMFHEGNLRNADVPVVNIEGGATGKFGLMQQWVERIIYEIQKYMDWPLVSKKMDDLAETYIQRLKQKYCQPQYTMVIDEKSFQLKEIKVASTQGSCKVPLFILKDIEFDKSTVTEIEQRGHDPATAWIEISENAPKTVKFKGDIKLAEGVTGSVDGSSDSLPSIILSWKMFIITLALIFFI